MYTYNPIYIYIQKYISTYLYVHDVPVMFHHLSLLSIVVPSRPGGASSAGGGHRAARQRRARGSGSGRGGRAGGGVLGPENLYM